MIDSVSQGGLIDDRYVDLELRRMLGKNMQSNQKK
jgi:hypothetical protein